MQGGILFKVQSKRAAANLTGRGHAQPNSEDDQLIQGFIDFEEAKKVPLVQHVQLRAGCNAAYCQALAEPSPLLQSQ